MVPVKAVEMILLPSVLMIYSGMLIEEGEGVGEAVPSLAGGARFIVGKAGVLILIQVYT
jgi:hypothetical protein